ncbi:mechanosensitive ion channel [Erythrobacter arachoides]|uniref:Small-conductance mechanosensitive channel n=1 Tax=Aurantiacibacter arachoides TaxID=1850444 RepID=A0A845A456_9SPHN|nr:mechanosensitive ion channel family protein [Aurantiacibacter arachoides]MXO94484.1 mechanosensitive ion channel [Aurantiacibacter arachoides]GGD63098.1 mechanosensitive ion channel protein MscS [Aurantiacibacter arachoides]
MLAFGPGLARAAIPLESGAPAAPDTSVSSAPAAGSIDLDPDPAQDQRIAARLGDIFANVPSLVNVRVSVSQGVVTLSGAAPDASAVARAEAIASGVDGVVTVENGVERDVSVDLDGSIGGLGDKVRGVVRTLPLAGLALLVALAIVASGYLLASLTGLWRRLAPNSFLAELIASAIRFVFIVLALVVALDMIGAGTLMGAVLGGAGVIGIALGFAMRDTVENYVASLMLSLRQPFRANDHVVIESLEGRVIRLTSRATVLMTLDGNHLRIPNSTVFKAVILNYTRNPQRRFDFTLGVDADDDAMAAREVGKDTLRGLDFVLDAPAPEVRIAEVGDSNVALQFLGWIDQRETDWNKARTRAIAACKMALEGAGFALPEPIYRLRFDPRTSALPFENLGENFGEHLAAKGGGKGAGSKAGGPAPSPAALPQPTPAPAPAPVTGHAEDVRPDDEIARMVDEERREAGGDQANDLLDHARPVE